MLSWGKKTLQKWLARQKLRRARLARGVESYTSGTTVRVGDLRRATVSQLSGVKLHLPRPKVRPVYSKILVVAGLVALLYVIFGTPIFVLDSLKITGQHLVNREEIEAVLFPSGFNKVNALTYLDGRYKKKLLDEIPQIAEVEFDKNVFTKVMTVRIVEHETSIIWVTGGLRYLVNRNGVAYEEAPPNSPLLPVEDLKNIPVSLNQQIVTPAFIEFVSSFVANLPRRTNISIRRIVIPETTFEVEMETDEGWRIILDTTGSYEEQLNNLVRVLRGINSEEEINEYVDLRIGKKVFFR
ncbi:MAG: cell division protein FtsQ/DivIB [Patescibacteria group bacterium]